MQYKTGKVWVANGSNTVYGTDGTGGTTDVAWENATITPGLTMLTISDNGTQTIYTITAVDTVNNTLTISEAYKEDTILEANAKSYGIHTDFTPSFNLPVMAPGDINVAAILARFAVKVDQELSAIAGAGANNGAAVDYAISVTGTIVVGTVIAWHVTNARFEPADADDADLNFPIGVIVSLSPVTMRVAGKITGIDAGFDFTSNIGSTYYLKDSATGGFNLDVAPSGYPKIAIMKATSASEGFLVLTPRLSSFTTTEDGLVPAPGGSPTGAKVLSDLGAWVTAPVSDIDRDDMYQGVAPDLYADAMFSPAMYNGDVRFPIPTSGLTKAAYITNSDAWFDQIGQLNAAAKYKSMFQMILELHRRIKVLSDFSVSQIEKWFLYSTGDQIDSYQSGEKSVDPVYDYIGTIFTEKTFSIPAGVKSLEIEMWGASGKAVTGGLVTYSDISVGGTYAKFFLDLEGGSSITSLAIQIGICPQVINDGSSLMGGVTRVYKNASNLQANLLATAWGGVSNREKSLTNPLPELETVNSPPLVVNTEFLASRTSPGPYGLFTLKDASFQNVNEHVHGAVKIKYIL